MNAVRDTTVDPFRPGLDDAEALDLRAAVWGRDHPHSQPAFFGWLFGAGNPAGPGSGVMLRRAGRLVGFAGLCPRLARYRGQTVRVAHGLDYMVSPELAAAASGRFALRVATEWARFAEQAGFAFGINFPNASSRRLLTSDRLGWRPVLDPVLMLRPLVAAGSAVTRGGRVQRFALRVGLGLGSGVMSLRAAAGPGNAEGAARRLDPALPGDASLIDALWARLADARPSGLVRDAANLHWRYGQHPLQHYAIVGWQNGDRLDAVVVTSRRALYGMECLLVIDALIDPARPAAAARLVGQALQGTGAALAIAEAVPADDLALALRHAGFLRVPRRFDPKPFTMVALPMALARADLPGGDNAWRFGWGDMDVV